MIPSKPAITIILNPAAKGERAQFLIRKLQDLFPEADLLTTKRAGHACDLAKQAAARGDDIIIAAGGDGTINEVVNGMAGSRSALGLLPVGTVNVFAMELGIPSKLEKAIEIIRRGFVRHLDLPEANGRYFVQLAGVGFDAQTVQNTDRNFKNALGPLSYVVTAAQLASLKPPILTVEAEGHRTIQGSFMLVGNGRFYGGPFHFFPDAEMGDGLLDICVFKNLTHLDLIRYFQGIVSGSHTRFKDVTYLKSKRIKVSANQVVPVEVDGELHGQVPVIFTVHTSALRFWCRKRTRGRHDLFSRQTGWHVG
ncbi:MAG: diacylglycerol kinase family lipid kinase [Blastochloris sp.]|nr:diacylglycerol kinase family lipid kinase [Blastochloris sp.]